MQNVRGKKLSAVEPIIDEEIAKRVRSPPRGLETPGLEESKVLVNTIVNDSLVPSSPFVHDSIDQAINRHLVNKEKRSRSSESPDSDEDYEGASIEPIIVEQKVVNEGVNELNDESNFDDIDSIYTEV